MPITIAAPSLAPLCPAPEVIEELAEGLWHLSLKIPAGSVRKNAQVIKLVARQMDDALVNTLGAPRHQGEAARGLMQELVGQAVTDAQMRDCTELERAYPDLRLAIGKVSLYFHQCDASAAIVPAQADRFDGAQSSVSSLPTSASSRAASATPQILAPVAVPPPAPLASIFAAREQGASPTVVTAPVPPPLPFASPNAAVRRPVVEPAIAQPMTPVAAHAAQPVPDSLRRCLSFFAALDSAVAQENEMAFICEQTGEVWRDPVINLTDGRTYERTLLPDGVSASDVVANRDVQRLIRCWEQNYARPPGPFATMLEGASPHDAHGNLIADPVMHAGGQTLSAQALKAAYDRGEVADADTDQWGGDAFCVNHLLVSMMQHFNIGVPSDEDSADALQGNRQQAASSLTQASETLERVKRHYASADYSEAFNAGLDLNELLIRIKHLIADGAAPDEQSRLLAIRAEARRLKGR